MPTISKTILATTMYSEMSDTISVTVWTKIEGHDTIAVMFELCFGGSIAPSIRFKHVYVNVVDLIGLSPVALMARVITAMDRDAINEDMVSLHVKAVSFEI